MNLTSTTRWAITDAHQSEIDALFAQCTNCTPGAAMAIYRDGEIVYANGYGMANLENNIPITPESIFDIASISKQFTAMCIVLLQKDGLLHIDDPIQNYIPELPQWEHEVTIRHLIHHVSGIRDYLGVLPLVGWREEDQLTFEDCLHYISRQRQLEFEPNTEYAYSNSGYVLLAILVERVSDTPMARFAHERILAPLGMTHSHFNDDHGRIIPGRAQAYKKVDDGTLRLDMMPLDDLVGDGGLFTNVQDFGKWIANFSTGTVGGAELLEQLQTPGEFSSGEPMAYAWGLGIDTFHGLHRVGHSGGWAGYTSNYFRLPEVGFGVAVFANSPDLHPGKLTDQIAEIVLDDVLKKPQPDDETGHDTSRLTEDAVACEPQSLAGVYIEVEGDGHIIIDADDRGAYISRANGRLDLNPEQDGTYTQQWGHFIIAPIDRNSNGQANLLRVWMAREDSLREYARYTADEPFRDYSGNYVGDELDTTWNLYLDTETDELVVRRFRHSQLRYRRIGPDAFGTGALTMGVSIRFERDAHESVVGFTYSGRFAGSFAFSRTHQHASASSTS